MKYIFFLMVPCFLFSCSGSDGVPSGIIAKPKMETILWQLMQVDEFTASTFTPRDSTHNLTTERISRYRQVFRLNQVSKDEFEKSYKFYMGHPDITRVLFDSINAKANRLRDEASHPQPVTTPPNIIKPKPNSSIEHIKLVPHLQPK